MAPQAVGPARTGPARSATAWPCPSAVAPATAGSPASFALCDCAESASVWMRALRRLQHVASASFGFELQTARRAGAGCACALTSRPEPARNAPCAPVASSMPWPRGDEALVVLLLQQCAQLQARGLRGGGQLDAVARGAVVEDELVGATEARRAGAELLALVAQHHRAVLVALVVARGLLAGEPRGRVAARVGGAAGELVALRVGGALAVVDGADDHGTVDVAAGEGHEHLLADARREHRAEVAAGLALTDAHPREAAGRGRRVVAVVGAHAVAGAAAALPVELHAHAVVAVGVQVAVAVAHHDGGLRAAHGRAHVEAHVGLRQRGHRVAVEQRRMRGDGALVGAAEHAEAAVGGHRVRQRIRAAHAHRHGQRLHQQRGLVQRRVVVAGGLAALALVTQDGLGQAHEAGLLVGREIVARAVLRGEHDEGVARRGRCRRGERGRRA